MTSTKDNGERMNAAARAKQMRKKSPPLIVLCLALNALCIAGTVVAIVVGTPKGKPDIPEAWHDILMCVLCLLLSNLTFILEKLFKVYVPQYLTALFALFFYFHYVVGEIFHFYDISVVLDKTLHTVSGALYAVVGLSLAFMLDKLGKGGKLSPFMAVLFAFLFALATEYIWELVEYCTDRLLGSNMQRWQDSIVGTDHGNAVHALAWGAGLRDSMEDMLVNVLGAGLACGGAALIMRFMPGKARGLLILTAGDLELLARQMLEEENTVTEESEDKSENAEETEETEETVEPAEPNGQKDETGDENTDKNTDKND